MGGPSTINPKSEAALAAKVMASLQGEGWDCYPEVPFGDLLKYSVGNTKLTAQVADIVALRGSLMMVVEAKRSFSLDLIEQAADWTRIVPMVAMAVPMHAVSHRNALKDHLREHFGLGLCGVSDDHDHVSWHRQSRLLRHNLRHVQQLTGALTPSMKFASAGASVTWRETAFERTLKHVRMLLCQHGPIPMKRLIDLLEGSGDHHYSSRTSLCSGLCFAVSRTEPDLVRMSDGAVAWLADKCPHGAKYVDHVKEWAARRAENERRWAARDAGVTA